MSTPFTPSHRGGSGSPLVLLHGFSDTWRSWELVLPVLERHHDVLAPTLVGHAGGPPAPATMSDDVLADAVERAMDDAGFATAHVVGNSLGGFVALQLAARGRARSVVALAPAGGWVHGDPARDRLLEQQRMLPQAMRQAAAFADSLVATREGRRMVTESLTTDFEHIPAELVAHLLCGAAGCHGADALIDHALASSWHLDAERIECPVRIVWGTADRMLRWPAAAQRLRNDVLPHAEWIELDGVGHCPQLDRPLETASLILEFAASSEAAAVSPATVASSASDA